MKAESNCNPKALNAKDVHNGCKGSYGLFQIACVHGDVKTFYDPETNVEMAYKVYKKQLWKAWGVCTDGKVKCG